VAPDKEGYLATMEAMLFQEESVHWTEKDAWRIVHERGFAIYRETYERLGGFPHEYGWFAGRAFAASLHQAGVPMGYAPDIRVVHFNSVSLKDIREGAKSFVFGEFRYREKTDEAIVLRYFGHNGMLKSRELYARDTTLTLLCDRLARFRRGSWPERLRAMPGIVRLPFIWLFGIRAPLTMVYLRTVLARVKVEALRPMGPAKGLEAYRKYWHHWLVRGYQLEYCRDQPPLAQRPLVQEVSAATGS
jgi:hypothetical protein